MYGLVNLVAIEAANSALAIFPLTDVFVSLFVRVPDHRGICAIITRIPHAIDKVASVFTLIVGPLVRTFPISHVIFKVACEGTLIVVVEDRSWTIQLALLVPIACVRAAANLDDAFALELPCDWVVVCGRRAISHREQLAGCEGVILPLTLNRLDISVVKGHCALAVQLVILDGALILDAIIPSDNVIALHGLIVKFAFVHCWALFVLTLIPLALREGSFEPAFATGVVVFDLALGHVALIKLAFIGGFFVREFEFSLTMALIHSVDLAFIARTIAIGHLLGLHVFRRLFLHHLAFCFLMFSLKLIKLFKIS